MKQDDVVGVDLGAGRVLITGLSATSDDARYRAMDWLLEIHQPLKRAVFGRVAEVLDLEVDGSRGDRTLISR